MNTNNPPQPTISETKTNSITLTSQSFNPSTSTSTTNPSKKPHLPLQYSWTLWHTAPEQGGGWNEHYKQIAQFSTVEEFWRLFNNISPPSLLSLGSSYHLFKGKVRPAWEDTFNKDGGAWAFRFSNFEAHVGGNMRGRGRGGRRGGRSGRGGHGHGHGRYSGGGGGGGGGRGSDPLHAANYAWYHNVLNMIGNNFSYSEDICGLIINIKKAGKGKIELWIKDASAIEKVMEIGRQFKDFSFSGPSKKASTDIEFLSFADQKNKDRSRKIKL